SVELHRVRQVNGLPQDTLVDTKELKTPRDRETVSLAEPKDKLAPPGLYDYRVEVKPVPDEAVLANNAQTVRVSVRDDKLAVLMIEDQPRWEYRYIANLLARDNRVRLQTMLLQPARIGWDADPSKNIAPPPPRKPTTDEKDARADFQLLPETQEEWYRWPLIVLGDVPPEKLPRRQQEMIAKAVTDGGATLIVLAGPLNMPAAWGTSGQEQPLAALFPCEPSAEWSPAALQVHLKVGYHPAVAPDGERHPLSQFGLDEDQNRQVWQTIRSDPNLAWYWHSEYTQARGGASVIWSIADNLPGGIVAAGTAAGGGGAGGGSIAGSLATRPTSDEASTGPTALELARRRALLATMNAGLGKVMYLAGDATWRLRQVNGADYHERFWQQVVRWTVGTDLPAGGQWVRFGSDKPRYVGGEQAVVTARVVDKTLAPQRGLKVKVRARVVGPDSSAGPTAPGAPPATGPAAVVEAEMAEVPDAPGRYQATLGNLPPGRVELTLIGLEVEALLADDPKATQKALAVEVAAAANLEQRNVNADLRTLASLAATGGGTMLPAAYAAELADALPELSYTTRSVEQVSLFADPNERYTRTVHWAFLATFVGLIGAEWIIRKRAGLV
ncbi:MAG: hypothetical protein JWO31_1726, partial [Phycisphaerales bacterium]|nr:hypothetical protein [Phycisphaerales bacterium]